LIANRLPENAVQERLGIPRPDIVLIHYAKVLDESAVAAAVTVRSKLSERSAEAGKCWLQNHRAASLFAFACK